VEENSGRSAIRVLPSFSGHKLVQENAFFRVSCKVLSYLFRASLVWIIPLIIQTRVIRLRRQNAG
jgi:hypothetical protein